MADRISFSTVQLATNLNPNTAPNPLGLTHIGSTTALDKRALIAITGDGDNRFEIGEAGHVLAAARTNAGGVKATKTLNGAEDPVTITGHGWHNSQTSGTLNLDNALLYSASRGFFLDTPGDRPGDSLTWSLNDKAGLAQRLDAVSFVVDTGLSRKPVAVSLDVDGTTISSGKFTGKQTAPVDAPRSFQARHGDVIKIDFAAHTVTVNGQPRSGPDVDLFIARHFASPQNKITIGGVSDFAVKDLVLDRSDRGEPINTPPIFWYPRQSSNYTRMSRPPLRSRLPTSRSSTTAGTTTILRFQASTPITS